MENGIIQHLQAIELLMCHYGKSFEEACDELNISPQERQWLAELQLKAKEQHDR